MAVLFLVLFVLAAVCFAVAASGRPTRVNLLALGLLFWVMVPLVAAFQALLQ